MGGVPLSPVTLIVGIQVLEYLEFPETSLKYLHTDEISVICDVRILVY